MAEETPRGISGWVKAGLTSVFGLISGAVLMYLTPLVNNVIKPGKPVANFAMQVQGLSVTFNNRSLGATQGWWDFGDGSALEAFAPGQDTVSHTYAQAGSYNVKLSLQNLLGEENDRTITVNIDPGAVATAPEIEDFQVEPVTSINAAPVVLHVKAKVKNSQLCFWSLGDDRPLVVSTDASPSQERYVTIKDPGPCTLRLVVYNGKQSAEKSKQLWIGAEEAASSAMARLKVTYDAVQIDRQTLSRNIAVPWTAGAKESASPFEVTWMLDNAHKDYQIVTAEVANKQDAHVRNLRVDVAADKSKYTLRGELVQQARLLSLNKQAPPPWVAQVTLNVEKRAAAQAVPMEEIPVSVTVPGTTAIPIPALSRGWQMTQKHMHLELCDGNHVVWSGERPPANASLRLGNRSVLVTAVEQGDRLILQVKDAVPASARPVGN